MGIHGAHGNIIRKFLSNVTNHRRDGYGGKRAARIRFGLELIEAARAAWPVEKTLLLRASCVDGRGGCWDLDDTVVLAGELKARVVDLVDCSSGGIGGC